MKSGANSEILAPLLELNRKALEAGATMTPAHYFLALAYLDLKQEQAAIAEFEKAIHSPYVTPEMYNALASLYIKKQRFAAAEDLCRKVHRAGPLAARRIPEPGASL